MAERGTSAAACTLLAVAATAALAACASPASEAPHAGVRRPPASAPTGPSAGDLARPQLPTVLWMRGADHAPLPADFASRPRDPFAAKRSADGKREGRVLALADNVPAAELVDLHPSADATTLVVRGAESIGFAGSLFWAFGGLGAVLYDTATNDVRTVAMAGSPVASPDGTHLAFITRGAVYIVDAGRPRNEMEIFRGDFSSANIDLRFAGDQAVVVPTNPARLVTLDGGSPITLPPNTTNVAQSPKGEFLAVASGTDAGSVVSLLAASDGRVIGRRALGFGGMTQLAWSPDDAHLVAAASPDAIWLMRSADGTAKDVAQLDGEMLVAALAVTPGLDVCVWTRTMTRTSCEGWPVYSIRDRKPWKNDARVCLAHGRVAALVQVDRARYLPLSVDATGTELCHWVLSADGRRYAGVATDATGAGRAEVIEVASRRVLHTEPLHSTREIGLAFFGATRLELTSMSDDGATERRQIDLAPPARKP